MQKPSSIRQNIPECRPFFVVGAQRSGTTMLRLMLNNHPNLAIPFETGFVPIFYKKLAEYGDLRVEENTVRLLGDISRYYKVEQGDLIPDRDRILSYPIENYPDLVHAIMSDYAERKGKRHWGDKTPFYVTELDTLWKVFPGCRIIHLVRDGRDVALSQRSISWAPSNMQLLAADWRWKTVLASKIGSVLSEHYLEVRYEDLVLATEQTLRKICRFIGEAYHEQMLDYPNSAEREMPDKSMQWHKSSIRAPDPSKVYGWKREMSLADRIIFEQTAGDALELFGYEKENLAGTVGSRLKGLYYCVFQRW